MFLTAYGFVSATLQSDGANQVARQLKNLILDTYDSVGGMSFEWELPPSINGEQYSIEILDKKTNVIGIIVSTESGKRGGSSISIPLSGHSFGTLKTMHYDGSICITNYLGEIYLETSKCS
jgi:hypothetical protein